MTTLQEKAAAASAKMQGQNPSVSPEKPRGERKRVPMTLPVQKLEVPEIPGYHLHWMRGTAARIAQAQNAGYEFVHPDEVGVNNALLGGDASTSGNTDMGSRVSIAEGSDMESGQPVRLYLMKQKMEDFLEDQSLLQQRNDSIADSLTAAYRTGQVGGRGEGETIADASQRYVDPKRTKLPEMFNRKRR